MLARRALVAWFLLFAACGDDGASPLADAGGRDGSDEECVVPALSPSWLEDMQREVVARLAGAEEISPGVTLNDRASADSRARALLYLEEELSALGYAPERHAYGSGSNLIAELPGETPGVYLLGAHFDSFPNSPGANDNATGVALVLAAARFLRDVPCRQRGVIFAFFDEEEIGLIGSKAYADKLASEGREVLGVWTADQLGWDGDEDRRLEIELPGPGMLADIESSIRRHGLDTEVVETEVGGTDHSSFRQLGFDAAGITEEYVSGDTTPFYHDPGDRFATVDLAFLANSTAVVHALLADLTMAVD